jgi:hypothetical protein
LVARAIVAGRLQRRYRSFLAAGGSAPPKTLLRELGLELGPALWQQGLSELERLLELAQQAYQPSAPGVSVRARRPEDDASRRSQKRQEESAAHADTSDPMVRSEPLNPTQTEWGPPE